MATKARKFQNLNSDVVIAPDLAPKDMDVKYTGGEPLFAHQPDPEHRSGALVMAFNWYSRFYDRKAAKDMIISYVDTNFSKFEGSFTMKQFRHIDDKEVLATYGWLARLTMRGLELSDSETSRLHNEVIRLAHTVNKPALVEEEQEEVKVSNRPNVQEIMKERAREAAGNLEGILDEFIGAGAKAADISVSPVSVLTEKNVLPQHVSILTEVWKKKLNEFQEVASGKDPQLNEAYKHYGKNQLKAVIKFIEAVLSGLDSYISVKKVSKAPRKRKAVSPEKQASKLKFMKTFEDATTKFKLSSVHPAKIVGAGEVWAFDTVKRKLHYYVADSHVGSLSVKGNTIIGFDASKSGVKTVRKPAELLKKLMTAGKPATRKMFAEINAVHAQPNGRFNDGIVILKVY